MPTTRPPKAEDKTESAWASLFTQHDGLIALHQGYVASRCSAIPPGGSTRGLLVVLGSPCGAAVT